MSAELIIQILLALAIVAVAVALHRLPDRGAAWVRTNQGRKLPPRSPSGGKRGF